jgi:hypothetical protein
VAQGKITFEVNERARVQLKWPGLSIEDDVTQEQKNVK